MYFSKTGRFETMTPMQLSLIIPRTPNLHHNQSVSTGTKTPLRSTQRRIGYKDDLYCNFLNTINNTTQDLKCENNVRENTIVEIEKISKKKLDLKSLDDPFKPKHILHKGLLPQILSVNDLTKTYPGYYDLPNLFDKKSFSIYNVIEELRKEASNHL